MFDFLSDFSVTVGESRNVPEMLLHFNGVDYNLFSWLHDNSTLTLVHSLRDLCGAFCYIFTIFGIFIRIPKILDGDFYGVQVDTPNEIEHYEVGGFKLIDGGRYD